jgi:hypothetical protein
MSVIVKGMKMPESCFKYQKVEELLKAMKNNEKN